VSLWPPSPLPVVVLAFEPRAIAGAATQNPWKSGRKHDLVCEIERSVTAVHDADVGSHWTTEPLHVFRVVEVFGCAGCIGLIRATA
jgi:hypothetical protein